MPGRPKTTLKRINELVNFADAYGSNLYELTPVQYREPEIYVDPVANAWQQALERAARSLHAIRDLQSLLLEKAKKWEGAAKERQDAPG